MVGSTDRKLLFTRPIVLSATRVMRLSDTVMSGRMVTLFSSKLCDDVSLQAIGKQRKTGSEGKETEASDHRAPRAAAG